MVKLAATVFVVALFLLLPLYEFADYNERWSHDGDFVQAILTLLLILEFPKICWRIAGIVLALLKGMWQFALAPKRTPLPDLTPVAASADVPLFLVLCNFRI